MNNEESSFFHEGNPCELCGMDWKDDPIGDCPVKLLKHYSELVAESKPFFEYQEGIKKRLVAAVKFQSSITGEVGDVIDLPEGRIKVIAPKKARVYWDAKALDGYAAAHPEILDFRTEKMPGLTVRIETI